MSLVRVGHPRRVAAGPPGACANLGDFVRWRQPTSLVVAASAQINPIPSGGAAPAVIAFTHSSDDPGNLDEKTSG
jgi:hypothetical protein